MLKRLLLLAIPLVIAAPAQARKAKPVMRHATGTFEVTLTPEAQDGDAARFGLVKTFSGAMQGTAKGVMISLGTPKPGEAAYYVALDRFEGRVDGKAGSFVLVHRGIMSKAGTPDLSVVIATDSGTGELAGIGGSFGIAVKAGVHHYTLDYTLPAAR